MAENTEKKPFWENPRLLTAVAVISLSALLLSTSSSEASAQTVQAVPEAFKTFLPVIMYQLLTP